MKKIFINGYLGFKNFGDDILFFRVLEILKKYLPQRYKIYYLSKTPYKINARFFPRYKLFNLFKIIKKDDVLVNIGGIFQDRTSCLSFFYYFLINFIFIIKKGKIVSLSIDIADLRYKLNLWLFRYIIRHSMLTVFRDLHSCSKFSDEKNIYYACDIGFLTKIKRCQKKKEYICIVLKPHKNAGYLIKRFNKLKDMLYIIMPEEYKKLKKYVSDNFWVYNGIPKDLIKIIQSSKFLISMRYHPAVIALKAGIPVIMISDENKILNFASQFGLKIFNPDSKKLIDKLKFKSYIRNKEKMRYIQEWQKIGKVLQNIL